MDLGDWSRASWAGWRIAFSWIFLVIPTYLAVVVFKWHLFVAWGFATVYIVLLGLVFLFRFKGGKWKNMLVIESTDTDSDMILPKAIAVGN